MSVRKAGWAATRWQPIQLISRAAKEQKVHEYTEGQVRGATMVKQMAEQPFRMRQNEITARVCICSGESSVQFELGEVCHAKSQFGLITQIGVTRVLYHP